MTDSDTFRTEREFPVKSIRWHNLPAWIARTVSQSLYFRVKNPRPWDLKRIRGLVNPDLEKPIFIVGVGRSGTTFLGECIGSMPGVSYHYEPVITKCAARYVYDGLWDSTRLTRFYKTTYSWLMRMYGEGDLRFAEKTPRNACIVPFLASAFPQAQFLHIVRDGRDVVASLLQKPWLRNICAGSGIYEPGGYPCGPYSQFWVEQHRAAEFEGATDLIRAAWTWRRQTEIALESSNLLSHDRYRLVYFENLVSTPVSEGERILDFLLIHDKDDRTAFLRHVATANPKQVGGWRSALSSEDIAAVEGETGDTLRRLNYCLSTDIEQHKGTTFTHRRKLDSSAYIRARRRRLLIVAPYPILPTTSGGKVRIVRLAAGLVECGFSVTVMTPFKPGQRRYESEVSFELWQVPYPFLLPYFFTDKPFPYMYLVSLHPGFALRLRPWLRSFDIIQFEHASFSDLLRYIRPETPVIYDAHNLEIDYINQESISTFVGYLVDRRIRPMENALVQRASLILSCANEERDKFCRTYGVSKDKFVLAPNGVQRSNASVGVSENRTAWPGHLASFQRKAIFSGSNVAHNRKAVQFIVDELAPHLENECGFVIQGEVGFSFQREKRKNVHFDTDWNSFESYVMPGVIGLNPVMHGAGTNLKLVHYMANGLPVISTPFGVRGYPQLAPYVCVRPIDKFIDALRSDEITHDVATAPLEQLCWTNIASQIRGSYLQLLDSKNE